MVIQRLPSQLNKGVEEQEQEREREVEEEETEEKEGERAAV